MPACRCPKASGCSTGCCTHGNRDISGRDFRWYVEPYLSDYAWPEDVVVVERMEWGNFYGYLRGLKESGQTVAEGMDARAALRERIAHVETLRDRIRQIERYEIGKLNQAMEALRLEQRRHELAGTLDAAIEDGLAQSRTDLEREYDSYEAQRQALMRELRRDALVAETMDGRTVEISLPTSCRSICRTRATQKIGLYAHNFAEFVSGTPREANTEGGIFPAIFATMMVILMSIIVTPVGVLAAIYLREYAKQGAFVRIIRISVNNLAGVPSIVFGASASASSSTGWAAASTVCSILNPPAPTFGTPD